MMKQFFQLGCFLILFTVSGMAQKTYFLKFNMTKGQRFAYRTGMDMNIDQNIMGQDVHVNTRIGMHWQFAVVGDSSGWKKIEAVFNRMLMHVDANGQVMDIDTDSTKADNPLVGMTNAMKAFIGQKFYYTMNEKGEVGQISGMKEIADKVKGALSGTDASAAQGMMQAFSDDNFKENMEQAYKAYPKKPVAIGETWTSTMQMVNNGIPMSVEGTYTLLAVTGDIATIKVDGKLKTAEGASVQGMSMTMTGTIDGTSLFELSSGLPMDSKSNIRTDMKLDMQGQEIPVKMDMKMNTVGKKL